MLPEPRPASDPAIPTFGLPTRLELRPDGFRQATDALWELPIAA